MTNNKGFLLNQLVKLGDMMGDGLHHEPDGKWIEKEYREICKALGYIKAKPRARRTHAEIDESVKSFILKTGCKCGGNLKQVKSGTLRVCCVSCKANYKISSRRRRRPNK